ncbi:MAG: hypothetical protein Q9227_006989 [Pyrenula ochraceoflavens]
MAEPTDLGLHLENTNVLVTGGAGFIGQATVQAFLAAGATVVAWDIQPSKMTFQHDRLYWDNVDISSERAVEEAFEKAYKQIGVIQCAVALASKDLSYIPHHRSLVDMPLEQWRETFRVNVEGTFLTSRGWLRQINQYSTINMKNVGLIIMGSEAGSFGSKGNADYASGKSAVQIGLVQSLRGDIEKIHPRARVNAVAPGAVDTPQFRKECAEDPDQLWLDSQATTALGKPVSMAAVARTIVFLASENWSGHVHGQLISVNSGKLGKVTWNPGQFENHWAP